jgi:exonuclease III
MKPKLGKIDKLSIVVIIFIILGVLSSFFDFGILSVFFSVLMPLIFIIICILSIYNIFKKKYFNLIGVIIFLLFYKFFFQCSEVTSSETIDFISVLSFNMKGFKQPIPDSPKQDASTEIIKFVDSLNADILVFQESNYKEGSKLKGYPYNFLGYREDIDKSLLAIYSKYPIIKTGYIDFPNTINNAIYADITIRQDTIRIYNSHLQSFALNQHKLANKYNDYNYLKSLNNTNTKQIEQAKLIKNHANNSNQKVIICGDFNSTPYSQTYRVLKKGMNDSYLNKGKGLGKTYSFFNYPLRLDYFLNDDKFNILSHDNFTLNLSDHEPIYIKFKIN